MNEVTYDFESTQAPYNMKSTQEWFASIITRELDEKGESLSITPRGFFLEEEATKYLVAGPTLKADKRIQIYNQQYWWRLLKTMHDNFPLVTRLFGYHAFNQEIAIPYILKYPPCHWSLSLLGERLFQWAKKEYKSMDLPLIRNSIELDWAFHIAFILPQKYPLDIAQLSDPTKLLTSILHLQPYVFLFKWDYDLLTFRETFLGQDVDYWTEHDFPSLPKERCYFAVYRNVQHLMAWKKISEGEYKLLQQFQKGASIEKACAVLENNDALYEQAVSHLQEWMKEWTIRQWLTLDSKPAKVL